MFGSPADRPQRAAGSFSAGIGPAGVTAGPIAGNNYFINPMNLNGATIVTGPPGSNKIVSFNTVGQGGRFDFQKNWSDTNHDTGDIVRINGQYDGVLPTQSTMGYPLRCSGQVGFNATAVGNCVAMGPGVNVNNTGNPAGGVSEFAIMTGVTQLVPTASNYGCGVWGLDITVRGANSGVAGNRDAYLTAGTFIITKYTPTGALDGSHFGANILGLATTPGGGVFSYTPTGTAFPLDDGICLVGWSGPVATANDGHQATATVAATNAIRIGGPGGVGWLGSTQNSKWGTGILIQDCTVQGITIQNRHTDNTAQAIFVSTTGGSVGIWTTPSSSNAIPLSVGADTNQLQQTVLRNQSAGAAAVTSWLLLADTPQLLGQALSIAGGNLVQLTASGNTTTDFLITNASSTGALRFQTNNTDIARFSATGVLEIGTTANINNSGLIEVDKSVNGNNYYYIRNVNTGASARAGLSMGNSTANQEGIVFLNGANTTDYGGANSVNVVSIAGNVALAPNNSVVLLALTTGVVKFNNAASFSANGSVATVLGSVGPAGSHTTVQKWLTIQDNGATVGYIPVF